MTARYGITVPFDDAPLHAQRERFERLVELGYTEVWSSEADGVDAITPLALAAAWAPTLRVGTAIMPVFTRGPGLIAQHAAALAEAALGGFACGIGASSPVVVSRWNGVPFAEPYRRTRDVVRFLKAALAGEKVTADYDTFAVQGFRLAAPPRVPPPVLVAALRPGMFGLAATEADGAILNWVAPGDVRRLADAADAAGAGQPDEIVARILVAPTEDADFVRSQAKRLVTAYLTVPAYRAAQEWHGRGEELAPVYEAWEARDRSRALDLVPDSLIDELVVHGSPERCRARIEEYVENGVTTPVMAILPFGFDVDEALEALAPG